MGTIKTQFNVRLSQEAAEAARHAATDERISLNEYIERLINADTDTKRAASRRAAGRFIAEWGEFIEAEAARVDGGARRAVSG
ncbi:toxin-antitoxin system HicB family antitoxin [Streptomyces sp. NPDC050610]|uniref:toxin-antitoxin system HicB family antitoxin n=1 Tax=Streptomyces sp. NPDC050610 TaxID=3157097 RepID=UPI00343BE467